MPQQEVAEMEAPHMPQQEVAEMEALHMPQQEVAEMEALHVPQQGAAEMEALHMPLQDVAEMDALHMPLQGAAEMEALKFLMKETYSYTFFNEELGWYCDYDTVTKRVMNNPTLAGMFDTKNTGKKSEGDAAKPKTEQSIKAVTEKTSSANTYHLQ